MMNNQTKEINEAIIKCKQIFGFNKQSSLKLIKNREEKEVLNFINNVELIYGNNLKGLLDKVIIERKTVKQHLLNKDNNYKKIIKMFEIVMIKSESITLIKTEIDNEKSILRLSGIGRIS